MASNLDIGRTISNGVNELLYKNKLNTVENSDFSKLWCDVVMLPAYRIEYLIQISLHTQNGYNRDEAVIYGFLMRIFRNLCLQRRLVCARLMTSELAAFWERILLEDSINLQYFILNHKSSKLAEFRLHSLRPEAFFEEIINDDIANNNGEQSPWQKRLLDSIYNTYAEAGVTYEEVRKSKVRIPSISDKFRDTGNKRLYDIGYRTKCHNVHGDWVDLTKNYLVYNTDSNSFSPNFCEYEADLRQLNPVLIICCDTIIKFIEGFSGHGISQSLCKEISIDQNLIATFDQMHDNYLNKRDLLNEIDLSLFDNAYIDI